MTTKRADLISNILKEPRRKFGKIDAPVTTKDHLFNYPGVPLKPLALQYLLQGDVFPVNTLTLLAGREACCKSSLVLWLCRQFMDYGGHAVYINAESRAKFPTDIARGLVAQDLEGTPGFDYVEATSADETQEIIQGWIKSAKEMNDGIREHNLKYPDDLWPECPVLIGLDSFAAAISQAEIDKIEKNGHGSASIAPFAKIWTTPLAKIIGDLPGSNVALVFIYHEKVEPSMYGARTIVGGRGQQHAASISIRLRHSRGGNSVEELIDRGTTWLGMSLDKNCMGGAKTREVELSFNWTKDGKFFFDFDHAAIETIKEALKNGISFGPMLDLSIYKQKYNSKSLDFTGLEASEVLQLVCDNPEIKDAMMHFFGITHRYHLNSFLPEVTNES